MWCPLQLLLLSTVATLCRGDEVFDVTTVYSISQHCQSQFIISDFIDHPRHLHAIHASSTPPPNGSCYKVSGYKGRIHSRTNALGLPLFASGYGDSSYTESAGCKDVITMDTTNQTLSWEANNWKQVLSSGFTTVEKDAANYFHQNIEITFSDGNYYLYFSNGPPDIYGQRVFTVVHLYLLTLRHSYYNQNQYYLDLYKECFISNSCGGLKFNIQISGNISSVCCGSSLRQYSLSLLAFPYITINVEDNKIKLYSRRYNPDLVFSYNLRDLNILSDIKYLYVTWDDIDSYKALRRNYVLSADKENAELVSPTVMGEDQQQLCLALVVYTSYMDHSLSTYTSTTHRPSTSSVAPFLQILAEDLHKTETHLYYVINTKYKEGWNVYYVNISIDKAIVSPFKLKIRKIGPLVVNITRIASCDPEGDEVQATHSNWDANLAVYTVSSNVLTAGNKNTDNAEKCLNGGVSTSGGCACPPGFTGADCGSGCGSNRFGQDCGGLCSLRLEECERFLLCTFDTGCLCAPGYKGDICDTRCSPGQYGNNCSQQCGHCASGDPCDIYTGECEACELGYHAPYCKQPYVYYTADPDLSSPGFGIIQVSFDPSNYKTDNGVPVLYQIQFREKFGSWQIHGNKVIPENDVSHREGSIAYSSEVTNNNIITESIKGLIAGTIYDVRVLFMDDNFNKYDGELVRISEIRTKCDIPEEYNYNVNFQRDTSSLIFSWTYINQTEEWCPVTSYEVSWKESWQWLKEDIGQESFSLTGFLPGSEIRFKVRARTSGGFAPYSKTVLATTQSSFIGTSMVRRLRLVTSQSAAIHVAWDAPMGRSDHYLQYTVAYKCVQQPACPPGCINATEGTLTQSAKSLTLSPLLPYARYRITVTPQDGRPATIHVGTAKAAPTEVPAVSARPHLRSNTSLSVFWDPVPVCSSLLQGYNYQLAKEADSLKSLASGFTQNTSVSFNNLTASTAYVVKVFIVTIAGWNPESFLEIHTSTSATVPEAVRNLTVYKRGRSMLGLRWAPPRATYGTLKSFTVTHSLGQESVSHTVEPTPCVAWPDLYCHTVEGLKSNRKYNVTVSARNTDVADDGVASSASGVTKESSPSAPDQLRLVTSGTTTVEVEWRTPSLTNGIVRSFVISVEETERFDQDSCCQVYPLVETAVKQEALTYEAVLTGLQPASTYYVSVSAKTVGMGPSQSLVVQTRPPNLPLATEDLPLLNLDGRVYNGGEESDWLREEANNQLNITDTDLYLPLVKAHLLLLVSADPLNQPTGVLDMQLDGLLRGYIKKQFYFYSEYNQGEEVTLTTDAGEYVEASQWGECLLSTVEGAYQPAAVRVTEYNGVFNADIVYFTQLQFEGIVLIAY